MIVHELRVEIRPDAVPVAEEILAEREDQLLMVVEDRVAGQAWVVGYFGSVEEARAHWASVPTQCSESWGAGLVDLRAMADGDWKDSYKAHFKASSFGRLHWVPVWERGSFRAPAEASVLWLDPGMAFGTGNHETTRLVAERLVEFATRRGTFGRVVDAGCGSGILALSAALLGFERVEGFDNDPEAIRVSHENAALNRLAGRVEFHVADLVSGFRSAQATLVLANIQADVLMTFASSLLAAVEPKGELVLSGILTKEIETVRSAFARCAPNCEIDSRSSGEWCDLVVRRG
jgi:ribosomal protein L11 methyltransferase